MPNNPFTLAFGKKPIEYIQSSTPFVDIIETFTSEMPSYQVAMLTGIRGCGKTVMLTSISKELSEYGDWYVLELNPERDMLQSVLSKLYALPEIKKSMEIEKIDLSFLGVGVSIKNGTIIADIEDAISRILEKLQQKKKKILFTIDEVVNNKTIREFASAFQILIRADLPVFMIMTGLYKNINNLQNADTLTFLYRTPKFEIAPLSQIEVAKRYEKTLEIPFKLASDFAKWTLGYPFAFQVLGHILYDNKENLTDAKYYDEFMQQLTEQLDLYVYDKVWSELSEKDREICYAIACNKGKKVKDIRKHSETTSGMFARYRDRLMKIGLLNTENYGFVTFRLPFFSDYVIRNWQFMNEEMQ